MTFEEIIVIKLVLFFLFTVAMFCLAGILPKHKDDLSSSFTHERPHPGTIPPKTRARSKTKSLVYKRPCSPTPRV